MKEKSKKAKTQFYTQKHVARECFEIVKSVIDTLNIENPFFLEPAAGTGNFLELFPKERRLGIDIEPRHPEVQECSYFRFNFNILPKNSIVCGNPPFGFQNSLTIKFINISAKYAEVIGFIVPSNFNRFHYSRHLDPLLHLIYSEPLSNSYFIAVDYGNSMKLRPSNFMVWSKRLGPYTDLRTRKVPIVEHPDFEMKASHVRNLQEIGRLMRPIYKGRKFVLAIRNSLYEKSPHKGEIITEFWDIKLRNPIHNWLLIYANNPIVRERLLSLDYSSIYVTKMMHEMFSKSDLVAYYSELYEPVEPQDQQLTLL